ncbi:hypothetical protein DAI22_04g208301 [Oryza sativa Japonica Group]|nr:hypothetical protein DAI22_04g208301 [Oryza sativa Japonica Group]
MHRKEAIKTVYREVGGECKDGSTIGIDMNSHNTSVKECLSKTEVVTTDSCPDRVIIPDPTPKRVNSVFYDILPKLMPILQKDNVQDFLRFFHRNMDVMGRDLVTPETFFYIIMVNSVRCAKVVLEGQAPELEGLRAYPNSAEIFSVDMIKLLIRHGALVNLRTIGGKVIEGLLPLHVALNPDYSKADTNDIYKLIHLLCLPEMKIFMDTTRLLAKHTNDLVGEICNYIKHGKLLQTAVLLLAAQEHIRGSKRNGNSKEDGFGDIIKYISEHTSSIKLDSPQVPHKEVLEHVSSILKFYNFCPTGEGISIESLNLQFGTAALITNHQTKRLFGTAALTLLKVLKKA